MENYELFWNNQINSEGYLQLVLDWDVFINNFSATIARYAHYQLNQTQKEYIKAKIDPNKTNEIYKNGFLLFAQSYWDIPSNRTNLFKMKMNLTNVLPRFNLMMRSAPQKLTLSLSYLTQNKESKSLKFEYRENTVYEIDIVGYEKDEKKVQESGFITVGSSPNSDISIPDSLFINKNHLKIASVKKIVKSPKKRNYYEQKKEESIEVTEWFIRDVARSNRLRYLLDKPHKYVFVKQQMVISFGLTGEMEVHIKLIDNSAADFIVSRVQQNQIESLLNADRINFMGEIDESIPLKTTVEMDFKEITPKEVEEMFNQKQYYPSRETSLSKGSSKKEAPSLTFAIFNKRTMETKVITAIEPTFVIGRSKSCKYRVNDIGVRDQELLFRCINGFWLISNPQPFDKSSFQVNQCSVFLTTLKNIQESKVSNRIQIREGYPYRLRGRQFQFCIELTEPKKEDDQF